MIPDEVTDLWGLALWFDLMAQRELEMADGFRIGGRYPQATQCGKQAHLWTQAAVACRKDHELRIENAKLSRKVDTAKAGLADLQASIEEMRRGHE